MMKNLQEQIDQLKGSVLTEHGFNREVYNLPSDIKRGLELIHDHLCDEWLTVEWLNKQLRVGKNYSGKFKAWIGITPKKYISLLRVQLANELINHNYGDYWQITIACGYGDPSTLAKAMSRELGYDLKKNRRRNS